MDGAVRKVEYVLGILSLVVRRVKNSSNGVDGCVLYVYGTGLTGEGLEYVRFSSVCEYGTTAYINDHRVLTRGVAKNENVLGARGRISVFDFTVGEGQNAHTMVEHSVVTGHNEFYTDSGKATGFRAGVRVEYGVRVINGTVLYRQDL